MGFQKPQEAFPSLELVRSGLVSPLEASTQFLGDATSVTMEAPLFNPHIASGSWEDLCIGCRGREHPGLSKAALLPQSSCMVRVDSRSAREDVTFSIGTTGGKHSLLVDAPAPVSPCCSRES